MAARLHRATDGLDERARSIVAYVSEHPDGVRAPQVADALDVDVAQIRQYLPRLYERNRVVRLDRGLYGPPVASVAVSVQTTQQHDVATLATPP